METINARVIDLKTFCSVVEAGSLANAARRLHETKSSVSRRITRLEDNLGVKLFDRAARSSRITAEGAAFYPFIRDAVMKIDDGMFAITESAMDAAGVVRISAPIDFSMTVLPEMLHQLLRKYPDISTSLSSADTIVDLTTDKVDIAIRITRTDTLPNMDYWATHVGVVRMGLYAAPKAVFNAIKSPDDLCRFRYILPMHDEAAGTLELLHDTKGADKVPVNRDALVVSDYATLAQFLAVGDAYGALPVQVAQRFVDRGDLVRLLPDWAPPNGHLWLLSRVGRDITKRVRVCREFLAEAFKETLRE
ncbi:LysR family transcriptional regulator [Roseovarius aestuarii]|uniref:HTH-type transcriptional regulator YofA n=1 Tax=Roseovarius aestuarii TaxID=475083 RepID=A0A1X7BNU4_9RHOB|nr:LysR family transcriptional regulator [Roseovarius aestuarii]SMC11224.1 HTH-type transcriptional regulator YofA [Roseovarius aestuarii]